MLLNLQDTADALKLWITDPLISSFELQSGTTVPLDAVPHDAGIFANLPMST